MSARQCRFLPAAAVLTAVLLGLALPAPAQPYPAKPVRLVLPFGPGSATDVIARVLAEELRLAFGQPFVIDYRPGASARIGAEHAARSAPDGYTLFVGTNTTHSVNPHTFRKLAYDPVRDFAPVSFLISFTSMLVIDPRLPATTVAELVSYARANPDKATYAWGNTISRVAAASLFRAAGVQALGIPYKSQPQAVTDVIAGAAAVTFVDVATGRGFIQASRLRALAVARGQRSPLMPELPAIAETQGFAGFDISSWVALFAPAGTPRVVIDALSGAVRKGLGKPEIREQFAKLSAEVEPGTPEELADLVARQLELWGRRVREAGIEVE
jgi:tripartite-type tricarboxylate transporter receptor subunit TctC